MKQSSENSDAEEQRGAGRRREAVPVPEDRRKDERRSVPGIPVLIEEIERAGTDGDAPETGKD